MTTMTKVAPAAPVAPWLGGKKALHKRIIARIEAISHSAYVEPFAGMGGVFLRRGWKPKTEVLNDGNGEVANLFRILQRHYPQLLEVMRFQITSRAHFDRLRATDPSTLTDLERAARFLYLQRLSFGGKVGAVFGVQSEGSSRFNLSRLEPILDAAHERLEGVVIENLDWAQIIDRYDHSGALFYLDPPYIGCEGDYGSDLFGPDQFEKIAAAMGDLKGAFILSINDCELARELFADFAIEPVKLRYTVSRSGDTEAAELIISNRKTEGRLL